MSKETRLPEIPAMNELLAEGEGRGLAMEGRGALHAALDGELDALRAVCLAGEERALDDDFWARVEARLGVVGRSTLGRALNATGVVLHTNLGRAPWPSEAVAAAAGAAGYAAVEVDPASGGRGRRGSGVEDLLCKLTGAEAGMAVNNNAGAVLLALGALARGRKVAVSRGELVEIGGSFRMPEVVVAAGAEAVEVGTTNRVHLEDFEKALDDPEVSVVFRAHTSNFRVEGFTAEPDMNELAALCRERGVALVHDLGSGILHGAKLAGLEEEPTVQGAMAGGADLLTFSGDKLLGGPQAGLVVGVTPLMDRLRRDPLARCMRLDKTILAALEAVLGIHALGEEAALKRIPSLTMLAASPAILGGTADAVGSWLKVQVPGLLTEAVDCEGRVGSGASPVAPLPGPGLGLSHPEMDAQTLAEHLRALSVPMYTRIQDDRVVVDLRTLLGETLP